MVSGVDGICFSANSIRRRTEEDHTFTAIVPSKGIVTEVVKVIVPVKVLGYVMVKLLSNHLEYTEQKLDDSNKTLSVKFSLKICFHLLRFVFSDHPTEERRVDASS